ncbi:hypothetical protein [Clostridium magnum]|uniref:Uncharacterized protein n=1 Tax=Clostridium magnum DSM 2767 TaxID=1121326 RepID=A0A162QLF1_9CLOT|nr:hypothetical protein [Clostridium magnum]KZL88673.1 hypothetical protein CLMAG_59620 [Clostridium magnum DSM 2767]SHJ60580.1 hypothetical protein SAMN02745944_06223 [Clostridium magnum DSM 2767]
MSEKINNKELLQELINTFDELIEYAMYMKMVTKYDAGKNPNLLLDACKLIVKVKESGLYDKKESK